MPHANRVSLFSGTIYCPTPGCGRGQVSPANTLRDKNVGLAAYPCPKCGAVTIVGKAPMIIHGRTRLQGDENLIIFTLCQEVPKAIKALGESASVKP